MAEGYSNIPHATYNQWKTNTIGHAYDLDGAFGCQCWDYASLFWRNVGFPVGYPQTGPNLYASECWTVSRSQNAGSTFDLVYNASNIKEGDILVFNGTVGNPPGHITFADEDYNNSGYIWCVGQNQGGSPLPEGGTAVTRNHIPINNFLGAFRYKEWESPTPPPPPSPSGKSSFPWVLYARKIRQSRQGL